jgi:hypothetical protein
MIGGRDPNQFSCTGAGQADDGDRYADDGGATGSSAVPAVPVSADISQTRRSAQNFHQ